jgi:hypothetical protein
MTSKSKNKGNTWEREIANHLSSIYNLKFLRCQGSGAFVGGKNTQRKAVLDAGQIQSFKGDIIPPTEWTSFNSEAKNYADFPFHQLYSGEVKQLETWLGQLVQVADPNDMNILMFKITRKGKYVAVESDKGWDLSHPHTNYTSVKFGNWQIFDYDSFWQHNHQLVKQLSTISPD